MIFIKTFNQDQISDPKGFFGPLYDYVMNDEITDVDWNGRALWLTYANNKRVHVKDAKISPTFVERFAFRVANLVSEEFNQANVVLEAETDRLRFSFLHESVAITGTCFCIRKSLPSLRYTEEDLLKTEYMQKAVLNLLINAVKARMNIVVCGETNTGKTELTKFLSQYIPNEQKVITIEDSPELHFAEINPEHDCIAIKVSEYLKYSESIKACLRQNPRWILLSEARSTEAANLLESLSTGENCITTIHCTDVSKVPNRFAEMIGTDSKKIQEKVFINFDIAVLIKKRMDDEGNIHRYISQLAFFSRNKNLENEMFFVVKDGEIVDKNLPEEFLKKFKEVHIEKPFSEKAA